jgi:uncharacterized protein (TIGR03382 family)
MSDSSQLQGRRQRRRTPLLKLMFGLFPLLVAAGFLAPGWVQLLAIAQIGDEPARGEVIDRVGPYGHRPLMVPRDFSSGMHPALLDLDELFLAGRGTPLLPPRHAGGVDAFDRSFGDLIAFDDFGKSDDLVKFKDVLTDPHSLMVAAARDDDYALPLCGTLYAGNCVRDDDFSGGFVLTDEDLQPVPEPDTAALMTLGLLGLAWQGRRRRSRR